MPIHSSTVPSSDHDPEWNDRLQDWLDADITTQDAAQFEQHLAGCARCQQQVAQMRQLETSLISTAPRLQLDSSFDEKLFAQIGSLDEGRRTAQRQQIQEEMQQSLEALKRRSRRALLFVLPGILGGMTLAFAFAAYLDTSGLADQLAMYGALETGANAGVLQAVLISVLGAGIGGILAGWLARTVD